MKNKLIIFLMMLFASFMLITSTNEVFAFEFDPETDPFEDLLNEGDWLVDNEYGKIKKFGDYEKDPTLTYRSETETNYIHLGFTDNLTVMPTGFSKSDHGPALWIPPSDGYGFRRAQAHAMDNPISDYTNVVGVYVDFEYSYPHYNGKFYVYYMDDDLLNKAMFSLASYTVFFYNMDYKNEYLDLLNEEEWNSSFDYGRLKKLDDYENDPIFNYDSQNEKVFIGFTGQYLISAYPSKVKYGPALWQSPYKNFKIVGSTPNQDVIKDIKNVAAVYYDVTGDGEYLDNELTIYYWEDNIILKEEVIVPYYGQAYFYGGIREAISGEETIVANVDNLVPLTDFLQYIEAWDDLDGDISDQVFIEDDGNYKNDVVGVYTVTFGVTDSENNTSYLEVDIHVVDIVAPTITGTTSDIQISYTDEFSVSSWVNSLQVTDNYYTSNLDITVKTNTYSANKTTPGNYYVEVKVTDGSGNVGTLIRNITVVDDKGPEFQGLKTITTSISENLTINDIKSGLAAIDAIDGNVTNSITVDSDQLTGNNTQPGTYEVIFKAVDSQGNASFHTVTVTIVSAPPKFYIIDGASIRLLPGANLTIEQILALLGVTDPTNLTTNYNAEEPGTYQLSFTVGNEDYNLNIIVLGANQPGIPPVLVGDNNFKIDWKIVGWVVLGLVAVVGVAYILKKKK